MVCKDICKVGSGKAMLSLPFGKSSVPSASDDTVPQVVREHAKRLPRNIDAIEGAMSYSDGRLTITVPSAGRDQAEFFPNPSPGVTFGDPKFEFEGQTLRMIVPVAVDPNNALGRPMHIAGVLGLGRDQGEPCYQFHIRLDRHGQPSRESQP
jgi:DsbC/DsbD-like thiol-disulfide interchange protein